MEVIEYTDSEGNMLTMEVPDIENLDGSSRSDILEGDLRDNRINGGAGNDELYGGPGGGDDLLTGGPGNDWLDGGMGNDTLEGGPGCPRKNPNTMSATRYGSTRRVPPSIKNWRMTLQYLPPHGLAYSPQWG